LGLAGSGSASRQAGRALGIRFTAAAYYFDSDAQRNIGASELENSTTSIRAGFDLFFKVPIVAGQLDSSPTTMEVLAAAGSAIRTSNIPGQSCSSQFTFTPPPPQGSNFDGASINLIPASEGSGYLISFSQPLGSSEGFVAQSPGLTACEPNFPVEFKLPAHPDVKTDWSPHDYPVRPGTEYEHASGAVLRLPSIQSGGIWAFNFENHSGPIEGSVEQETSHSVWIGRVEISEDTGGPPSAVDPFEFAGYQVPPMKDFPPPPDPNAIKKKLEAMNWWEKAVFIWDAAWAKAGADLVNGKYFFNQSVDLPPVEVDEPGIVTVEVCPSGSVGPCTGRQIGSGTAAVRTASASSPASSPLSVAFDPKKIAALRSGSARSVVVVETFKPSGGGKGFQALRPLPLAVAATQQPAAKPTTPPGSISSVTFSGGPSNPTIAIHGHNLGRRPAPSPPGHPSGLNGCPILANDTGYDYGTSLYLANASQAWAIGRYRPQLNETDCLDLIVTRFTPTEVELRIGPFYKRFYPKYELTPGLQVQVVVDGTTFNTTVKYG
jgi:hypothetical protein